VAKLAGKTKILVVDDDIHTQRMLYNMLALEGYQVTTASNGEFALQLFDAQNHDLILLDIRMPGINGYDTCRRIREFSQVPILMVTAKDSEPEKIEGLDAGADDYITKPFSAKELLARIKTALRRTRLSDERPARRFSSGDLAVDTAAHVVTVGGKEIKLTATEYRLISYLIQNAGRVLTPDMLLSKVWGEGYYGDIHLLHVAIARLRTKLGDNARKPRYILTKPGIGYTVAGGS
jgi:two-component system KDP operon response regulator KdpE